MYFGIAQAILEHAKQASVVVPHRCGSQTCTSTRAKRTTSVNVTRMWSSNATRMWFLYQFGITDDGCAGAVMLHGCGSCISLALWFLYQFGITDENYIRVALLQ